MKNIEAILKELGIELTAEQKTGLLKGVEDNYKTIADYDKQKEKLVAAEGKITTTEEALKAFDGVDIEKLNEQIGTLKTDLATKETDYQKQITDRDFNDILKDSIASAKGVNRKAIQALLDTETLKASKNQKEDVAAAIKALTEAEDSKMLFGDPEAQVIGTGDIIGKVGKASGDTGDAQMRAVMGLPPTKTE